MTATIMPTGGNTMLLTVVVLVVAVAALAAYNANARRGRRRL